MIGIQLDGRNDFLETKPDTKITVRLENPLFGNPETLNPGSYSYPFELPAGDTSPGNATKLSNPDVIENNEAFKVQQATLFFDGTPFKKGDLKTTESIGDKLMSYFVWGLTNISQDIKTARLRDVVSENVVISNSAITRKIYLKKNFGGDIGENIDITLNGRSYNATDLDDLIAQTANINESLDRPDVWIPKAFAGTGPTPYWGISGDFVEIKLAQKYTFAPGVILERYCTDPLEPLSCRIDSDNGFYAIEVDMGNYYDGFRSFLNPYALYDATSYPDNKLRFPFILNARLHGNSDPKNSEWINAYSEPDGMVENDPNNRPAQNINSIQPFLMMKWVLDKIAEVFSFTYEGEFYTFIQNSQMLIDNSVTLDVLQDVMLGRPGSPDKKFVMWRRSFNLSELVPDVSVIEFFKALAGRYNAAIYYNDLTGKVRMRFRENIIKATTPQPTDITDISSPKGPVQDKRLTGFSLRLPKDTSDNFSEEEILHIGTPQDEVPLTAGRLFVQKDFRTWLSGAAAASCPYVSRENNARFSLRVFFYTGIKQYVNSTITNTYPSAEIHGPAFNEDITSLYNNCYRYWLNAWKNRRIVKLKTKYTFSQLHLYNYELKRRYDRSNYYVKSIEFTLSNQDISVSEVELWTA